MADRVVRIAEGFWNVRGSFKIGGLVEIGTQTSLARLASGKFVLLDAYDLDEGASRELGELTRGFEDVEAILNLHPFHTVHVEAVARRLPHAKLYGTARHVERAPELPWEPERTEGEAIRELFAGELTFTVPRGVDFISDNPNLHFSSVLAIHDASRTLHVDDTLTWVPLPLVGGLVFHPTLKAVLEPRAGAAADFRAWAAELIELCEGVEHLCTAHARALPPQPDGAKRGVADQVRQALRKVEKVLAAHERRHG